MPKHTATGLTYTANRVMNIGGTVYAVGATIPNASLKVLRKLDALVARRYVVPSAEPYVKARTAGRLKKPKPTHYNAKERANL